jgi:hypothetical protein
VNRAPVGYDLRTNQHFTLKQNSLRRHHLDDFVASYQPGAPRSERVESERFKAFFRRSSWPATMRTWT